MALAAATVLSCKGPQQSTEPQEESLQMADTLATVPAQGWDALGEEPELVISTTLGDMTIKLYSGTPLHRDNFVKLAKKGYYNDILFHRIIRGFMIQTGDPYSKDSTKLSLVGTGGPGYTIPAEFRSEYHHKKGALAAARRGDAANPAKESSGSQFYIVQDEDGCRHLDGEYTIFGEVVKGLEVIDAIASEPTDQRDRPLERVAIISILPAQEQVEE